MKRHLILLALLLLTLSAAKAQITISGTVRHARTQQGVADVNVMLQRMDGKAMYTYMITRPDGSYSLTYEGQADSLIVAITGFNIKAAHKAVAAVTQRVDFTTENSELSIREVVVKAPPITRQSDTVTYAVSKFSDITDRSIADVLKKMPGVEVDKSGLIKVHGEPISKLYIEGLDMLGGRYGLATNNIQAKDIASVQILENHQPVKALRDVIRPTNAAINLKLKESSKGTWNGTLQLGAGYKPWMWNAEATAMYFGRKFQTLNTYKTNNSGDDVGNELTSHYGGLDPASSMLGVQTPTIPPLEKKRYLDNNIHAISLNAIRKIDDDVTVTANGTYKHDYQTSTGSSTTTYYLPEEAPLTIVEQTYAALRSDVMETSLEYKSNANKSYLTDKVAFGGTWERDFGEVLNDGEPVSQRFRLPRITVSNKFHGLKRLNKISFNFTSTTDYNTQPSTLRISPLLYPEIFGDETVDYGNAVQSLASKRFRSQNSAYFSCSVKRWTFFLNTSFNAHLEWLDTSLNPMNDAGVEAPTTDIFRNDIYFRKLDAIAGPTVSYRRGDRFYFSLYLPVDFMSMGIHDDIRGHARHLNRVLVNPSLNLNGMINHNLKYSAYATYRTTYGGLYDSYGGYIMTDYRRISSKEGEISRTGTQDYSASLNYGNAIRALFGTLSASYSRSSRNLMYGTQYIGTLSQIESYAIDNDSENVSLNARISKRFDGISTTVTASGSFLRSWIDVLRQGEIMQTSSDLYSAGLSVNTRFSHAVRLDYTADYSRSRSYIAGGEPLAPIDIVTQHADLYFIIAKRYVVQLSGEHYYNGSISHGDRSMFFADASFSIKTKRVEYMILAQNLLDTNTFRSAAYNDITNYVYAFKLRPASVMFKVKFSLK